MRNQRGMTLVELLGVLAITGLIMALLFTAMANGSDASQRTSSNQRMQQEANYIVEVIRSEYLKEENSKIELEVEGNGNNQELEMNSKVISQGYEYQIIKPSDGKIDPEKDENFILKISSSSTQKFTIRTTFSKLR